MRAFIQRVREGSVTVDNQIKGQIDKGLVILIGVGKNDGSKDVDYLVRKTINLRIFPDQSGKLNYSLKDIGGAALVISQFTLYADTKRGNRPGFEPAADPKTADILYKKFVAGLKDAQIEVETGIFQANMLVNIANDGPVTILLESPMEGTVNE
jgi:D-aminoacyl-tRNA deacylase